MPLQPDGDPEKQSESAVYDQPALFTPYEPPTESETIVQPTSPSPAPSSDAPDLGGTSGEDDQPGQRPSAPDQPEEEQAPPLPEFDSKHREPFSGLLYLGRLEKSFSRWGHRFVVRTATTEELAEIGLITAPYRDTQTEMAVYQTAVVAACTVSVDGKPLPQGITNDTSTVLASVRYPFVAREWVPAVREEIYNEIFRLEMTVRQVLAEMGKASG